jgi:hypothetical protein
VTLSSQKTHAERERGSERERGLKRVSKTAEDICVLSWCPKKKKEEQQLEREKQDMGTTANQDQAIKQLQSIMDQSQLTKPTSYSF